MEAYNCKTCGLITVVVFLLLDKTLGANQVLYHCTFEANEDCRWEQDPSDELDWQVHGGSAPFGQAHRFQRLRPDRTLPQMPTTADRKRISRRSRLHQDPSSNLIREFSTEDTEHLSSTIFIDLPSDPFPGRPFVDHTYGNYSGHFAHLVAPDSTRATGHARILSPPLTLPDSVEADLTFFYHLWNSKNKPSAGQLKIYACEGRDLVFTATADLGSVWMKAEVRVKCNGTFRIIFEGFIGAKDTDIAIDDVNVTVCNSTPGVSQSNKTNGDERDADPNTTVIQTAAPSTTRMIPTIPGPAPNDPETGVDPETAVSLVVIALVLFAGTCFMLLLTLMIHIRFRSKRRRRGRFPEPFTFGSEFFNRHSIDPSEATAYMTLNFPPSSTSGSGVEFLALSERHSCDVQDSKRSKPSTSSGIISKHSSAAFQTSPESVRRSVYTRRSTNGQRRQSRTFPASKELKNIIQTVHMRRFRTLSQHLSEADVENLRRTFYSQGDTATNSDRTVSTVLLDTTASSIRPISDISDHFYYSLFPAVGIVSCKNSLVACEESEHAAEEDGPSRPCSGDYDSDDLEVQAVTSGSLLNRSPVPTGPSETSSPASVTPETTEMFDNEIYESYANSDASSTDTVQ